MDAEHTTSLSVPLKHAVTTVPTLRRDDIGDGLAHTTDGQHCENRDFIDFVTLRGSKVAYLSIMYLGTASTRSSAIVL